MSQSFPWNREFQIEILALMIQQYEFLLTAADIIKPEYFEDKVLQWFFVKIHDHKLKYMQTPTINVLSNAIRYASKTDLIKSQDLSSYTEVLKALQVPVHAKNYTVDQVVQFCRRQAGRRVYLETAPLLDNADDSTLDEILEKMWAVRDIGQNMGDLGTDYFGEVMERLNIRANGDNRTVVKTNIVGVDKSGTNSVSLDDQLGGGLKSGQLGIWLGGTGGGKSIALAHCGRVAVHYGFKVVHYTLELDAETTASRYDAAVGQVNFQELKLGHAQIQNAVVSRRDSFARDHGGYLDPLYVKYYPAGTATVNTLRSNLRHQVARGWTPDLVLVDYLDLLKPQTNYDNEYADLGAITRDLYGLAGEFSVPIWTATQTNRAGLSAEIVDIEHIGDSLKKAQIADIIIALCSTPGERKEDFLRLYLAKNRNGPAKGTLHVRSNYAQMMLFDGMKKAGIHEEEGSK